MKDRAARFAALAAAVLVAAVWISIAGRSGARRVRGEGAAPVALPAPRTSGRVSVEEALSVRRSVRTFADRPLPLAAAAQILWAAQGTNRADGRRTCPSAGARYPLETYLLAGDVEGLPAGVYRYRPATHDLERRAAGDARADLAGACNGQVWIAAAPAALVLTAVAERVTSRYGRRGEAYVHLEAGHAAENVHLQAAALSLGTVVVGSFDDPGVEDLVRAAEGERALVVMPLGAPR